MRYLFLKRAALPLLASALSMVASGAATKIYDEAAGVVIVEAEHPSSRTDEDTGNAHKWLIVPGEDAGDGTFSNARGDTYLQTMPNSGDNNNATTSVTNKPWADYLVSINTAGKYQMYMRWNGAIGNNSMYAEIVELKDGPGGKYADWYRWGYPDTTEKADDFSRGWDGNAGFELVSGDSGDVPATWDLTPGTYTVRLHMREDSAAVDAFALQLSSLAAPGEPGAAESAQTTSYVRITAPPVNGSATVGGTATFSVTAEGSANLTYQWQSKAPTASSFTDVAGATAASYTTPTATDAMNGTQYQVKVSNGTKTAISPAVTLSTDSTPPALKQLTSGAGQTSVALVFSEKLDKTSAETAANYTINGLNVTAAKLDDSGTRVILTTARQTAGTAYTVTAAGVKDAAGNIAASLTGSFTGATIVPNKVLVRFYKNIGGTAVADLTSNARYPNYPDEVALWDAFSSGDSTADTFGENYGAEVTGLITPTTTGTYKFYIRSDDASQLLLSTDDTEAGLRQIAAQGGCCNAFTDAPGTLSSQPIDLTAGKSYYFKAYLKEGGGGDFIQVGWLGPNDGDINDATAVLPIPGDFLSTGFSKTANVVVTQAPTNVTVGANSPAVFTVAYDANSVLGKNATVQWQRAASGGSTFTDITDATNVTYTIPFATSADTGAKFRAIVSVNPPDPVFGNPVSATSDAATLTVSSDTTPPAVTAVSGGVSKIVVSFSEPLDATTAGTTGNYQVNNGVNVTGAQVISAGGEAGQVQLTLTGVNPGSSYNVTISGVKDSAGNVVASTTKSFEAYHIISNFDTGLPPGAAIVGNTSLKTSGSYDGSGMLQLTDPAGSQQGSIVFPDQLDGAEVNKFTATFKLFIGQGSGNPADGFSFNVAPDIAADITAPTAFGEEGTGSGLTVAFDTYDNGGGEAPAISLKWAGNEFATTNVTKATLVNNQWVDVVIQVKDGNITVQHNNIKYYDNLPIDGWAPIAGAQVGLGARTGGESEVHRVDDLKVVFNADVAVPQPPTISITSPTPDQHIAANAPFTLTVNAQDPENDIRKVEYFVNGQKLGESTTAPFSFTIPSVPQAAYLVTARVTDGQGISVSSAAVKAIAGNPDKILLVTTDTGPVLSFPGDQAVYLHLLNRGYDVVLAQGDQVPEDGSTANGTVLIVQSSSLGSGTVETGTGESKFKNLAIPAIFWEASNVDGFGFQEANAAPGTTASQSDISIVDATSPLAAGLPAGLQTVVTSPQTFSQAQPVGAHVVATLATDPTQAVIANYDKGEKGFNGFAMPARRVFFFFQDNTADAANATGWKLFDAATDWALNKTPTGEQPSMTVTKTDATHASITWTAGGTLQSTASLNSPISWTDAGSTSPVTVDTTGGPRFYRVRK